MGVAAALGAVAVLITLVYWPGTIDPDTTASLHNAATGHYTDWHAPVLEMLWHLPYRIGLHSPGWVLFADVYTLLLAFYLILRVRLSRVWASVFAVICCAFPPVLTWTIHIGNDTWFAAGILCAFGFVARVARTNGGARTWSIVGAVWFAAIASAARHNAVPAVLVLFVALFAVVYPKWPHWRRIVVCGLGLLGTVGLLLVQYGVQSAVGTASTHPVQSTYYYDLAQMSKEEHKVLLPPELDPGQSLATIDTSIDVHGAYALFFGKLFSYGPVVHFPVEGQAFTTLQKTWKHAVLHDRGAWLRERARVGVWMLSIGHPSFLLYSAPAQGYPPAFPSLNRAGFKYLTALAEGPVTPFGNNQYGDFLYDGWIYALISVAGAIVLWRRTKAERVISGLTIAMLLYTIVLAFAGPGELYRYIYPLVATGSVVLVLLLAPLASNLWRRRQGPSSSVR
ncbi:MAG: hypothetical protein J2P57_02685 [Acidimicrobiaceae bacterium]|nr:hypothetical protein [Acidimicrobiaceae bacterium]